MDESNARLLTQRFWVQAIYMLHAFSRSRAQREEKRPPPLPETGAQVQIQTMADGREGLSPILDVRANVDWLILDIYHFFPRRMKASLRCLYTESLHGLASCFTCSLWLSAFCSWAAWRWKIGSCSPDRSGTCGHF